MFIPFNRSGITDFNSSMPVTPKAILVISLLQKQISENISRRNVDQNPSHNSPSKFEGEFKYFMNS